MLLFDWNKIVKISKGNVGDIIQILRIITYKIPPKNYYDKTFKFYKYKFGGKSYLLNPKDLLERRYFGVLRAFCGERMRAA